MASVLAGTMIQNNSIIQAKTQSIANLENEISYKNNEILTISSGGTSGIPTDSSLSFSELNPIYYDDFVDDDSIDTPTMGY